MSNADDSRDDRSHTKVEHFCGGKSEQSQDLNRAISDSGLICMESRLLCEMRDFFKESSILIRKFSAIHEN